MKANFQDQPDAGSTANGCAECAGRRKALKSIAAAAAVGAGIRPASAADEGPRKGDWLVGVDDDAMAPLGSSSLKAGEKQLIAYPFDPATKTVRDGSRLNRIVLIKLDPAAMDDATRARAADGVVAYSAFCTHQGCDVSSWLPKEQMLLCFCHFTKFAPLEGAAVKEGPAPRPLPALALRLDGGRLVVADGFSSAPGKSA